MNLSLRLSPKSSETQLPSQNAIGDRKFATSASANGSNDRAFRSAPVRASPDRWEVGFWIKLNQEERLLLRGFPDEYPGYMARVKALIPYVFLTPWEGTIGISCWPRRRFCPLIVSVSAVGSDPLLTESRLC